MQIIIKIHPVNKKTFSSFPFMNQVELHLRSLNLPEFNELLESEKFQCCFLHTCLRCSLQYKKKKIEGNFQWNRRMQFFIIQEFFQNKKKTVDGILNPVYNIIFYFVG